MDKPAPSYPRPLIAAAWVFIAYIIVYILIVAHNLLIPLVFAVLIWYLLNTVDHILMQIRIKGRRPPRWIRLFIAIAALLLLLNLVIGIVAASVSSIMQAAPQYQQNLDNLLKNLPFGLEIEEVPALSQLSAELDLGMLIQRIAREFAGLLGNMGLIIVYLAFLLLEGRHFREKIANTCGSDRKREWILSLLSQIDRDIKRYIGVKTMLSLVTSIGSWIIMRWVGLDFAGFWALLIFVLNFIPNLGSIAATILPSVLALLQFDTLAPFLIIILGIGSLQMMIGNLLDPALMGKSLNVSPLVIIFSLVFWGVIWGLPGMFLCVPITIIAMIILSNFENTRWIALVLSKDGNFKTGSSDS